MSHLRDTVDGPGPANGRMRYDQDKMLCIGTVMIERTLREGEKGNVVVVALIELAEFYPARANGTRPHWARNILNTVLYLRTEVKVYYIKRKGEDKSLTGEHGMRL